MGIVMFPAKGRTWRQCNVSGCRQKSFSVTGIFGPIRISSGFAGFKHQYARSLQILQCHFRIGALAQLSLFAASIDAKSLILKDMHTNSLHYKANVLLAGTGDGRAVIFGGGCLGKVRRKWSSNRRCSGSGWV